MALVNPGARALLGTPAAATVTITDDDCTPGTPDPAFGTAGVLLADVGTGRDSPWEATSDGTWLYGAGWDEVPGQYEWRIEKRSLVDGSVDPGFGTGGGVSSDPTTTMDLAYAIAVDATHLYVAGFDEAAGNGQLRLERRSVVDGQPDPLFGGGSGWTSDPSAGFDAALAVVVEGSFVYAVGKDQVLGAGSDSWRIEKLCR